MRENSEWAIWKAKALRYGATAESMKEISRMAKKMVKEHSYGLMEINILAVGEMISNTALVSITMSRIVQRSKENGSTGRDINGSSDLTNDLLH
jgi:hypothetical protein